MEMEVAEIKKNTDEGFVLYKYKLIVAFARKT
jgi:hypothetical protein